MCGIAGYATRLPKSVSDQFVRQAVAQLEHRGPDDHGFLATSPQGTYVGRDLRQFPNGAWLTLVHRRLSIIDLSDAGWQPMSTDDGRYHIVYNGEIYNYVELRRKLEQLGHRFRSDSDTEVLLNAYVQWGTAMFHRLVGMFAFAVLDVQENRLLLARDFFGIKPLYYRIGDDDFAFGSEIKVLVDGSNGRRRVNPRRLYQYLCFGQTDHGGETLFEEIRQLPPAHYLTVDLQRLSVSEPRRYWNVEIDEPLDISFPEAAGRLRDLFLESVRLHLRSDVPVGAALSGGIDSSAIVMAMRHIGGRQLDLHTFSYIADDEAISEERWIDLVVRASGAVAHKVRSTAEEMVAGLPHLTRVQDEPFGSTSIYAQNRVFQLAHENGIKVMLDGQGADELLAGYRSYFGVRLASLVRQKRFLGALKFWNQCSAWPGAARLWTLQIAAAQLLPGGIRQRARRWIRGDLNPQWLNADWFRSHGVRLTTDARRPGQYVLREFLKRTLDETSLPALLRYEDRNSMAYSIESRVPFLTPQLAEFILALPEHYLISPTGVSKSVFREAMRGIVPDEILDRRDKIGFATPEQKWLSALRPWVADTLSDGHEPAVPALKLEEVQSEWERVFASRRPLTPTVWHWLNTIEWSRRQDVRYDDAA